MAGSNRRGHNLAAPFAPHMSPVFPLPRGRGEGQDGDVAYLYTRTQNAPPVFPLPPSIGIGTQPQQPTSRPSPAAQRHNCPAAHQRSPSGYCLCPAHTATIICKQSCTTFVQRNKNIILCRSKAKNECRTPANAVNLQHPRKFSCTLQLCPRPAHIARFNVRARESD